MTLWQECLIHSWITLSGHESELSKHQQGCVGKRNNTNTWNIIKKLQLVQNIGIEQKEPIVHGLIYWKKRWYIRQLMHLVARPTGDEVKCHVTAHLRFKVPQWIVPWQILDICHLWAMPQDVKFPETVSHAITSGWHSAISSSPSSNCLQVFMPRDWPWGTSSSLMKSGYTCQEHWTIQW